MTNASRASWSELDYIVAIYKNWPSDVDASDHVLELSTEAVRRYPQSRRLVLMRGDLLAHDITSLESRHQAHEHYLKAVAIDPLFGEAWEMLGLHAYASQDDLVLAEECYRRALALYPTPVAYIGFSRVLVEMGRASEAREVLSKDKCVHYDHPEIIMFISKELSGDVDAEKW
jgi:tetratricopeptide (TPR) repeat protein